MFAYVSTIRIDEGSVAADSFSAFAEADLMTLAT